MIISTRYKQFLMLIEKYFVEGSPLRLITGAECLTARPFQEIFSKLRKAYK